MSNKNVIKSYKTSKRYKQDRKRMLNRGFNIEHEMLIVGELQVEYKRGRNGPMDNSIVKLILNDIQDKFDEENMKIISGDITQLRIGVTTGIEIALNIVKSYSN